MSRQPTIILLYDHGKDAESESARRLLVDRTLPFYEVSSKELNRPAGYASPTLFVGGRAYKGLELIRMAVNNSLI